MLIVVVVLVAVVLDVVEANTVAHTNIDQVTDFIWMKLDTVVESAFDQLLYRHSFKSRHISLKSSIVLAYHSLFFPA